MTISREEIFGPVLAAIEFADVDEAIALANDTIYGLAAGVWTRDIKKAHRVARSFRRAPSGSTPTTSTTRPLRSAATSRAASAAKWARTRSSSTRR